MTPDPASASGAITLRQLHQRSVGELRGVGPKKVAALAEVGVQSVLDLLTTYPRRWVDRTEEARVIDLEPGREALVLVTVRSVAKRPTRNRRTMVTAQVGDGSGRMSAVFFNQPWRERQLQPGMTVALFGRADTYRGSLQMTNPVVDLIGDRTGRIVPIYPQSEKADLNTWEIAGWVESALERCTARGLADPVPAEVLERLHLIGRQQALFGIHAPETMAQKEEARRRLAFDELLAGAARAGPAQAGPRARSQGHTPRHLRCPGGPLPWPAALRPDGRPAGGHRRDRGGPGWPTSRCTGCSRATSGRARPWWR